MAFGDHFEEHGHLHDHHCEKHGGYSGICHSCAADARKAANQAMLDEVFEAKQRVKALEAEIACLVDENKQWQEAIEKVTEHRNNLEVENKRLHAELVEAKKGAE